MGSDNLIYPLTPDVTYKTMRTPTDVLYILATEHKNKYGYAQGKFEYGELSLAFFDNDNNPTFHLIIGLEGEFVFTIRLRSIHGVADYQFSRGDMPLSATQFYRGITDLIEYLLMLSRENLIRTVSFNIRYFMTIFFYMTSQTTRKRFDILQYKLNDSESYTEFFGLDHYLTVLANDDDVFSKDDIPLKAFEALRDGDFIDNDYRLRHRKCGTELPEFGSHNDIMYCSGCREYCAIFDECDVIETLYGLNYNFSQL